MFHLQSLEEEEKMTPEQLAIKNVGKQVHITIQFLFLTFTFSTVFTKQSTT